MPPKASSRALKLSECRDVGDLLVVSRDQLDTIQEALNLSIDHLQLFALKLNGPLHETRAGHAIDALDVLVQDLSSPAEVKGFQNFNGCLLPRGYECTKPGSLPVVFILKHLSREKHWSRAARTSHKHDYNTLCMPEFGLCHQYHVYACVLCCCKV